MFVDEDEFHALGVSSLRLAVDEDELHALDQYRLIVRLQPDKVVFGQRVLGRKQSQNGGGGSTGSRGAASPIAKDGVGAVLEKESNDGRGSRLSSKMQRSFRSSIQSMDITTSFNERASSIDVGANSSQVQRSFLRQIPLVNEIRHRTDELGGAIVTAPGDRLMQSCPSSSVGFLDQLGMFL
jgi:uncharacterized protein YidB (DUF937 family)